MAKKFSDRLQQRWNQKVESGELKNRQAMADWNKSMGRFMTKISIVPMPFSYPSLCRKKKI